MASKEQSPLTVPSLTVPSLDAVALALGVHRRTVSSWRSAGMPYRARRHDLAAIIGWLFDTGRWLRKADLNATTTPEGASSPALEAERLKADILAERLEILRSKRASIQGSLVSVEQMSRLLLQIANRIQSRVTMLSQQFPAVAEELEELFDDLAADLQQEGLITDADETHHTHPNHDG